MESRAASQPARHIVASVDEIPPGSRKVVEVDGREIGVFNVNGEYFAILNRCPHQGGPLCKGRQTGFLTSPSPGDYRLTRQGEVIRCPWHGWEFDLRTGQSWCEPGRIRVRQYPVSVEPGAALVTEVAAAPASPLSREAGEGATAPDLERLGQASAESGMEGLVKGPYVAETYPVSVEQQYVVIQLPTRGS